MAPIASCGKKHQGTGSGSTFMAETRGAKTFAKTLLPERRRGQRFPLRMEVEYRLFPQEGGRMPLQGKVQTVDISNTGVLLKTRRSCPLGSPAELSIEWPHGSDAAYSLELRLIGSVVRTDKRGIAVRILRYQFQRNNDAPLRPITPEEVESIPGTEGFEPNDSPGGVSLRDAAVLDEVCYLTP
jgi:hypothetical protein